MNSHKEQPRRLSKQCQLSPRENKEMRRRHNLHWEEWSADYHDRCGTTVHNKIDGPLLIVDIPNCVDMRRDQLGEDSGSGKLRTLKTGKWAVLEAMSCPERQSRPTNRTNEYTRLMLHGSSITLLRSRTRRAPFLVLFCRSLGSSPNVGPDAYRGSSARILEARWGGESYC